MLRKQESRRKQIVNGVELRGLLGSTENRPCPPDPDVMAPIPEDGAGWEEDPDPEEPELDEDRGAGRSGRLGTAANVLTGISTTVLPRWYPGI